MTDRFKVVLIGLVLALSAASSARSENLTWYFANDSGHAINVELYSDKRQGHVWPGNGEVWTLPPNGATYSNPISCQRHEKICYGAWLPNDENSYWGVGHGNKVVCKNCCYDCIGKQTQVIRLTPGAMPLTSPTPSASLVSNPEYCNPIDLGAKILRSANANDLDPEWMADGGVGTGWSITNITRQGDYLTGTLNTARGNPTAFNIYVLASEWECH